jgi:hypothetical protein
MATGYGLTNKGKATNAGEELQDIDWDKITPEMRGPARPAQAKNTTTEPDPWEENQAQSFEDELLQSDDYSQVKRSSSSTSKEVPEWKRVRYTGSYGDGTKTQKPSLPGGSSKGKGKK